MYIAWSCAPAGVVILGDVSAAATAVDLGGNVASSYASYAVGSAGGGPAPVPEPSTFALLGAGAIAMLAYAYRPRKWAP